LYNAVAIIDDPGYNATEELRTITINKDGGVCPVVTTGTGDTRTLRQPTKAGIVGTVVLYTDAGDLTLTVTGGYNADADTAITFDDAGDFVRFMSINVGGTYYWRVIAQEGTNAAAEDLTVDQLTATTSTITDLTATSLKLAVTAVAAAGSLIGEGGSLVAGLNVVSAADNTKVVDLPATVAGTVVVVTSQTAAKTLPVFPPASSSIDNLAANVAKTIGAATATTSAVFVADNATHWVTVLGDTA
jgi:hypothetical protein